MMLTNIISQLRANKRERQERDTFWWWEDVSPRFDRKDGTRQTDDEEAPPATPPYEPEQPIHRF